MKQFENIDEFEKVTDHASTNDTCEEATETNIQNKNAQLKSLVSADMRRKQLDMCLKNVDIGSLEENQTHLKPSIVDTSLVKGNIIQVGKMIYDRVCVCLQNKIINALSIVYLFFYNRYRLAVITMLL